MIATWLGEWSAAYAASPGYAPGDQVAHLSTSWACNVLGTQQEPGIGADWSHLDDLPVVGSPGQAGPPPPPPHPSTANLLLGDTVDFEGGTLGDWTRQVSSPAGGTWAASTEQAHGGTYSMKLTCDGSVAPARGTTYMTYPWGPGVSYQAGLWVYAPAGQPARCITLSVEWGEADTAWIGEDNFVGNWAQGSGPMNTIPGEWAYLSGKVRGTLYPTVAKADFWLTANALTAGSIPPAGEVFYFDDFSVTALAP